MSLLQQGFVFGNPTSSSSSSSSSRSNTPSPDIFSSSSSTSNKIWPYPPTSTPISPPVPHRKAPRPPTYKPRRHRARHIRMQEPAKLGLFTVCEVEESSIGDISSNSNAEYSIQSIHGAEMMIHPEDVLAKMMDDGPQDVDVDAMDTFDLWDPSKSAWSPDSEDEDPFSFDGRPLRPETTPAPLSQSNLQALDAQFTSSFTLPSPPRPRRPPPLDLSRSRRATQNNTTYQISTSPDLHATSLLPALPILPPSATSPITPKSVKSRPQRLMSPDDPVDLISALEDLLSSCGEALPIYSNGSDEELDVPTEVYHTPSPFEYSRHSSRSSRSSIGSGLSSGSQATPLSGIFEIQTPRTPRYQRPSLIEGSTAQTSRPIIQPSFKGDHSFLQSLSGAASPVLGNEGDSVRSRSSSRGSNGSSESSRKSLPERNRLPMEWRI